MPYGGLPMTRSYRFPVYRVGLFPVMNNDGSNCISGRNYRRGVKTQKGRDKQEIIEGCRRLIHNAIVCWNYLYLSELVANADTDIQKQELIEKIRKNSILTWGHVNMLGEYDFSVLRNLSTHPFDVSKILSLIL